jgi:hypothetical protein
MIPEHRTYDVGPRLAELLIVMGYAEPEMRRAEHDQAAGTVIPRPMFITSRTDVDVDVARRGRESNAKLARSANFLIVREFWSNALL